MNGNVDNSGRALIELCLRPSEVAEPTRLTAWVDTAFTGELILPRSTIQKLKLPQSAAVTAGLADGTQVVLETFSCIVEWFGRRKIVEVVGNDGQVSLLGVGMLLDRKLEIDYRSRTLLIE